ncbi:hypothetical protein PEDI_44130 [Persicobacter diffluens]|uniref:Uncharacterized protein n=1 Tax=Persicobacter diffluens TaxID=981 RepID=A0AAN4W1B5_9BACT|nr:hypothetical protein PEDI_44130 [Persicobacter diffluens]
MECLVQERFVAPGGDLVRWCLEVKIRAFIFSQYHKIHGVLN